MKKLTCEMCGGIDLIKQDGVFVCQTCGAKYSIEDARKMMIDGHDNVSGSIVKVDTSDELRNLYQIARRAKDDNNCENAARYYDMILVKDPTSWEASFYVVFFKAMECKVAQIRSAAISVSNCEDSVLALIRDYVPETEQIEAVREVVLRSSIIANALANGARNHYDGISSDIKYNYTQEYIDNVCAARDIMYTCGTQVDRIFSDKKDISKYAADAWKVGIEIHKQIMPLLSDENGNKDIMVSYAEKIGKYEADFAKTYVYNDKKERLLSEIYVLRNTISKTPIKPQWRIDWIICAVGFILLGAWMLTMAATDDMMLFLGALEIIIGGVVICKVIPQKDVLDNNRKIVEEAKEQLTKKEAELRGLIK